MRGSITKLSRREGYGFILAEDGNEVYFDKSEAKAHDLRVGQCVEFELQYALLSNSVLRAVHIRRSVETRTKATRSA